MITRKKLLEVIKDYPYQVWERNPDATNNQIISQILLDFPISLRQAEVIAPYFKASTTIQTLRNIYDFLTQQIKFIYVDAKQDVKSPFGLIRDGVGDCKSFTLFANSIMGVLGYEVQFKFASYDSSPLPTHVYAVIYDNQKKSTFSTPQLTCLIRKFYQHMNFA